MYENDKRMYIVTEKCTPLIFEEIKTDPIWGIYEIVNAVNFINSCNYVHCLINPLSVFVTSNGKWKLSLFDCIHNKNTSIANIYNDIRDHLFCTYGYKLNIPYNMHSMYIDTYGLSILMAWAYKNYIGKTNSVGGTDTCTICNDYDARFSLHEQDDKSKLLSKGKVTTNESNHKSSNNILPNKNVTTGSAWSYMTNNNINKNNGNVNFFNIFNIVITHDSIDMHNKFQTNLNKYIPEDLCGIYNLLNTYKDKEISFQTILNDHNFKNNHIVKTMLFLTELHMKSKSEKKMFFNNLYENLDTFPVDTKLVTILPELTKNVEISENNIICLKIICTIAKDLCQKKFEELVYPIYYKYFLLTDRSIRYALLESFSLIKDNLTSANMNELCNSYMYGLVDNDICIKNESIKNYIYIYPKLKNSFKSSSLNTLLSNLKENNAYIKINTIICITKISNHITADKQNILYNVFHLGIGDSFQKIRLVTIQSIKYTFNQFNVKRFVSGILPLLINALLDDALEVRSSAFDTLEFVISQLKIELLKNESVCSSTTSVLNVCAADAAKNVEVVTPNTENLMVGLKNYKFVDKIKDIIMNKTDTGGAYINEVTSEEEMNLIMSDYVTNTLNITKGSAFDFESFTGTVGQGSYKVNDVVSNTNVSNTNVGNKNVGNINVGNKNVSNINVGNKNVSNINVSTRNINNERYNNYVHSSNVLNSKKSSHNIYDNLNNEIIEQMGKPYANCNNVDNADNAGNTNINMFFEKEENNKWDIFSDMEQANAGNHFKGIVNENINKINGSYNNGNVNSNNNVKDNIYFNKEQTGNNYKENFEFSANNKIKKKKKKNTNNNNINININDFFDEFDIGTEWETPKVKLSSL
uniref:Protein kinase n=1 Tax=Piliocolobus tephrosceles TaxID=591936 RepID=A0A8C9GIY7_9PRIM